VLEEAFEAADKNGDGILSADEYLEIFQSHGLTIGTVNFSSL
jgi:Ca2+-binding EF-hand superfamily protein